MEPPYEKLANARPNSFCEVIGLDSKLIQIVGKVSADLIQLIEIDPLSAVNTFNDTAPDRFCIRPLLMLNPYSDDEGLRRLFNGFHSEPFDFSS